MEADIQQDVLRFVRREFLPGEPVDALAPDTNLFQAGILDSIRRLTLVSYLEDTYAVCFEPADLQEHLFGSVAAIAGLVRSKLDAEREPE